MLSLFRSRVIAQGVEHSDPRSKSVDHIVPLSLGGDDTAINKRAAHLRCNTARGNRMVAEQLPLFGTVREMPVMVMEGRKRVVERRVKALPPPYECCGVKPHAEDCASRPRVRWSMDDARRARDMRLAGTTWREIAAELGMQNTGNAYLLAKRAGPLPSTWKCRTLSLESAIERLREKVTDG